MSEELVIVPLKLTPSDRAALKQVAKDEDITVAALLRSLLNDYMSARSTTYTGEVKSRGAPRRTPEPEATSA